MCLSKSCIPILKISPIEVSFEENIGPFSYQIQHSPEKVKVLLCTIIMRLRTIKLKFVKLLKSYQAPSFLVAQGRTRGWDPISANGKQTKRISSIIHHRRNDERRKYLHRKFVTTQEIPGLALGTSWCQVALY